jgi:hypothetical protein
MPVMLDLTVEFCVYMWLHVRVCNTVNIGQYVMRETAYVFSNCLSWKTAFDIYAENKNKKPTSDT